MKRLSPKDFDKFAKKRFRKLIQKGERPTVVGGFIDFFGDGTIVGCNRCETPIFLRPWIHELVVEHNLPVLCICCADWQGVKGQIIMDFAKIEEEFKGK